MTKLLFFVLASAALLQVACAAPQTNAHASRFRLMTIDPGHFHAALVQKFMYPDVDPIAHVFAPAGDDLNEHVKRIERFNTRDDDPTRWELRLHTSPDFFEKALAERPGNVAVLSGNNAKKTDYILRSVKAGLNVLADKPMAITPADFAQLQEAFSIAAEKNVLLYDIMTERFEIATILQRELSRNRELFGELARGTPSEPAITKESVHHFSKTVAGAPLKRPQWFFDVRQQGEGLVDVTTHLVDLVQWEAFPNRVLAPEDVTMLSARRWTTPVSREEFKKVTGAGEFPAFLQNDVKEGVLQVYANGEFTYRLRGVHAKVSVTWAFEAPPGGGDTHFSVMRGSRANLVIRQGREQQFKPTLYVEPARGQTKSGFEATLKRALAALPYEGLTAEPDGGGWRIVIPDKYHAGHEAHFAEVMRHYLDYLRAGKMPEWETPNMITKYATIMKAYEMSR